ncbi:hypothetical protein FBU59_001420, partial [Linderina macrospora]
MALPKVFIIYYSTYGHVLKLTESIKQGLESTGLVSVEIYQVPETLSDEILTKMHAPPKADYPVITADKLAEADGFLFGIPTRYGTAAAQVKSFFDSTGQLWAKGALQGKLGGFFFSTASQHGGQETTAMTFLPNFAHHGIVFVPLGYKNPNLHINSEVVGGSPWGAGTVANGDGSRQPTELELAIA